MDSAGSLGALVAFSFESRIVPELPLSARQRLFRRAALFNSRMQLTGELRLDGDWFTQTVEGRPEILLPLAGRIIADGRHEAIRVRYFGQREARAFTQWTAYGVEVDPAPETSAEASNVRMLLQREPVPLSLAARAGNPVLTGRT